MKKKGDIRLSDEIREKVKALAIQGHSERYIANKLNISNGIVNKIKREIDNFEQLRANKKEEIIKTLWDIVINALKSIDYERFELMKPSELMTTAAIAIDKAQLLSGEVTDRLALVDEKELDRKLNELETAEKELKAAWKRATAKRKKAAEDEKKAEN